MMPFSASPLHLAYAAAPRRLPPMLLLLLIVLAQRPVGITGSAREERAAADCGGQECFNSEGGPPAVAQCLHARIRKLMEGTFGKEDRSFSDLECRVRV
jgi:hypothetical protein